MTARLTRDTVKGRPCRTRETEQAHGRSFCQGRRTCGEVIIRSTCGSDLGGRSPNHASSRPESMPDSFHRIISPKSSPSSSTTTQSTGTTPWGTGARGASPTTSRSTLTEPSSQSATTRVRSSWSRSSSTPGKSTCRTRLTTDRSFAVRGLGPTGTRTRAPPADSVPRRPSPVAVAMARPDGISAATTSPSVTRPSPSSRRSLRPRSRTARRRRCRGPGRVARTGDGTDVTTVHSGGKPSGVPAP